VVRLLGLAPTAEALVLGWDAARLLARAKLDAPRRRGSHDKALGRKTTQRPTAVDMDGLTTDRSHGNRRIEPVLITCRIANAAHSVYDRR
jgi:hypothetical protein